MKNDTRNIHLNMNWNAEMKCTAHDVKKLSTQKLYISRLWHFGKVKGFTYVFKILQKCWMPGLVCVLFLKLMLSKCLNWKKKNSFALCVHNDIKQEKRNKQNKTPAKHLLTCGLVMGVMGWEQGGVRMAQIPHLVCQTSGASKKKSAELPGGSSVR